MKDIAMHMLDIVQNSIAANASEIEIVVDERPDADRFVLSVADNGCGMDKAFLLAVTDPFTTSRTTRRVGLGIPFLSQTCSVCGGFLDIKSKPEEGTHITAEMEYKNIDRPPLGNMPETVYSLILTNPEVRFIYTHKFNQRSFCVDTSELKEILGGVPLTEPEVMKWLKEYIFEGIVEIRGE